jgi:ABC-type uncharacterized transport system permease subunit
MRIGNHELKFEKRESLPTVTAVGITLISILFAFLLFSLIFVRDGVSPLTGYREIFKFAFTNKTGLGLTINRSIFILLCTCAFIIPFRAGLWNIGMAGQMYAGSLGTFAILYAFGTKGHPNMYFSPGIIALMLLSAGILGAVVGGIAGYIKGKFNVNEIVTTMMINSIMYWMVANMIKEGGAFMNPGGRSESFDVPISLRAPLILKVPFTVLIALLLVVLLYWILKKTSLGYQIKAYGLSPSAAKYAGISLFKVPLMVFSMAGFIAGLAGYHYFAAVPGVYKIARNYDEFGDLSFYGIICGLIALGEPLATIPIVLLFGGLTNGGRLAQGKLQLTFGIDYALLGIMMIVMVAFQFFYRNRISWKKIKEEK